MKNSKFKIPPIVILGGLFFIFGFVTWLNATLIPYLKIACKLNNFQAMLVTFAFYISYFVTALPSSYVLNRMGLKKGMTLGLLIMAMGALIFIPAALTRTYEIFLCGLFTIGTGLSLLQTASNPYITIVGPIESAASRISIMGICNKTAGVLAPLILAAVILSDSDILLHELQTLSVDKMEIRLDELARRVIIPYGIMAAILTSLAFLVRISPLPEIGTEQEEKMNDTNSENKTSILQFPHLLLGVAALFLYVACEVIAGDTIGPYGTSQGIPLSETKRFTAFTLSFMLIGYVVGIFTIPRVISQARALAMSAITGIVFSLCIVFTNGYLSVFFVALLGFSNALVWPAIWPLAIAGVGRFTQTASALLIMSIAGGALLPLLYGQLADMEAIGSKNAYWMLVPCYMFILFYALKGHKIKQKI